jgi:hypothetical protein
LQVLFLVFASELASAGRASHARPRQSHCWERSTTSGGRTLAESGSRPGFPKRASLPEEVPALIERDLEFVQATAVRFARVAGRIAAPELMFLGDELSIVEWTCASSSDVPFEPPYS